MYDYADLSGLQAPTEALAVAVAGGHHTLLVGSPGSGAGLLLLRIPTIAPPMDAGTTAEVAEHYQEIMGRPWREHDAPPFRMPHYTASVRGMLGGGRPLRGGEVTLADHGVLAMVDVPEFSSACTEGVRGAMDAAAVHFGRDGESVSLPARFVLVATMAPCPCGFLGHPERACVCSPRSVERFLARVEWLRSRVDVAVHVERTGTVRGSSSAAISKVVERARAAQETRGRLNGRMSDPEALEMPASRAARGFLAAVDAKSEARIRRVARTLADMAGRDTVGIAHVRRAAELFSWPSGPEMGDHQ